MIVKVLVVLLLMRMEQKTTKMKLSSAADQEKNLWWWSSSSPPVEDVLVVPKQWAKRGYEILTKSHVSPKPWHLEGRFGSRTHPIQVQVDNETKEITVPETTENQIEKNVKENNDNRTTTTNDDDNNNTAETTTTTTTTMITMLGLPIISKEILYMQANKKKNINQNQNEHPSDKNDDDNNYDNGTILTTATTPSLSSSSPSLCQYKYPDLHHLLYHVPNVHVVTKPFVPSWRAHDPPDIDATIHPERAPIDFDVSAKLSKKKDNVKEDDDNNDKNNINNNNKSSNDYSFTYAEMFAGIGGFAVALEKLGGKCIFCSELEEHCRAVYQHNFPPVMPLDGHDNDDEQTNKSKNNALFGDIYQVQDDELPKPSTLDILVGGFPCQPFSSMGNQPGLNDEKGILFYQIVRVLKISKPKSFLLENVPGLYNTSMKETLNIIINALSLNGTYTIYHEICSSRGITATARKRIFFVGIRKCNQNKTTKNDDDKVDSDDDDGADEDGNETGKEKEEKLFQFPYIPDLKLRACHVLDYDDIGCGGSGNICSNNNKETTTNSNHDDDNDEENDNDEIQRELSILRLSNKTMKQLISGGRFRPASLAWPNKPCDTIVSHYGNSVGRGESQLVPMRGNFLYNQGSWRKNANKWNQETTSSNDHSSTIVKQEEDENDDDEEEEEFIFHSNPRRFSIRECARIMGFPNTYRFLPPRTYPPIMKEEEDDDDDENENDNSDTIQDDNNSDNKGRQKQKQQQYDQGEMAYRKEHYRMIGNAVCPPLIAALAGAVLDHCNIPLPLSHRKNGGDNYDDDDNTTKNNKNTIGDDDDDDKNNTNSWVKRGREVAIELALAATRPEGPALLPPGCLVPPLDANLPTV